MKRVAAWTGLAVLVPTLGHALAARLAVLHVFADSGAVLLAFAATRFSLPATLGLACVVGYVDGRAALTPVGLSEFCAVATGFGLWLTSGNMAGGKGRFVALAAGLAAAARELLAVALLLMLGRSVGFSSWATALLLPRAAVTALLAWVSAGMLARLDAYLAPAPREGLHWR